MRPILILHMLAGSVALLSGYLALFTAKGAVVHRRSGLVFVGAMLTMCAAALTLAIGRQAAPAINVPAALMTAYLVITSLGTVRPGIPGQSRRAQIGLMSVALGVAIVNLVMLAEAMANGGKRNGIPAFSFVIFAAAGLLGGIGDLTLLLSGPLVGAPRLARHLWRMCFALFIAALSFFIGQAKVIPKPVRILPLLALPVLIVLVTMLYWLWRVRIRRTTRRLVAASV